MAGTNIKDNKVMIKEDVMIFSNSGVKIITGVESAETTIRDMTLNPGDMVITTDGTFSVLKDDMSFTDISAGWKFTAPTQGKYQVSVTLLVGTVQSATLYVYKNGVQDTALYSLNTAVVGSASTDIQLNAGDFIDIRSDGSTAILNGNGIFNTVSIKRVGN